MKKYVLVVRSVIFDADRKIISDDEKLKALNCYWESPVYEYDDSIHQTAVLDELIDKYEKKTDALPNCRYELKPV